MKILRRRIVSSSKLSEEIKNEYRSAHALMEIPNRLKIVTKFATIPDVMKGVRLEADGDLDKKWLHGKIADPRYQVCHLHMTQKEWEDAGIRDGLWGSSGLVKGTMITYGRWKPNSYTLSHKYSMPVKALTELARGSWHENDHAARRYFTAVTGKFHDSAFTHYHFYGYDRKYSGQEELQLKPKRYVRTPDPIVGWQELPWEQLKDAAVSNLVPQGMLAKVERTMNLLIRTAKKHGFDLRVTSGWRSFQEQDRLYAQGRTTAGKIVTNAKGGESLHNYGCAFDLADRKKGYNIDWEKVGKIGESLGFEWGGRWTGFIDRPHFQMTLGYSLKHFQNNKVDYTKFN